MDRILRPRPLVVAIAALLAIGCGQTPLPRSADPNQAREALRAALDTWRRGETAESLKQHQPAIQVVDHEWRDGTQLTRYELLGDGRPSGADLRCEVRLWLRDRRKKVVPRKATYSVGIDPIVTVVREDL